MPRNFAIRHLAAIAVAAVALEILFAALGPDLFFRSRAIAHIAHGTRPSFLQVSLAHLSLIVLALVLMVAVPRLWHGKRTAVWVAIGALAGLVILNLVEARRYDHVVIEAGLALLLAGGRRAFPVGSRNRPRPAFLGAGFAAWGLVYVAALIGRVVPHHRPAIRGVVHHAISAVLQSAPHLASPWVFVLEALIAVAIAASVLAVRSVFRPVSSGHGHSEDDHRRAREITEHWGEDSLSPFVLRPDKALYFDAGGVLAFRLIGETAVVSSDPVAPPDAQPEVLRRFLELARRHGWDVALWAASGRNLEAYRALGLRAVCAGEEAFVDPAGFSLEGRHVRKLRQSVNRVAHRGWQLIVCEGRDIDEALESEIDSLEKTWRANKRRILGFAMGMGTFMPELAPDDLYVLARSPEGDLRAVMRFLSHRGRLSLEAMRRVGKTPNGLNEALVAHALEAAAKRGVCEVSLNYAGLAHLVRPGIDGDRRQLSLTRVALRVLGRRFQLERLVRFNDKFSPEWRPRFLVYESRSSLPRAAVRVLQAEGYLREPHPRRSLSGERTPRPASGSLSARVAG